MRRLFLAVCLWPAIAIGQAQFLHEAAVQNATVTVSNSAAATPEPSPVPITNVQKLSLDPATAVGTNVSISDGFWVSGAGDARLNGFYWLTGAADFGGNRYINIQGTVCQKGEDPNNFFFVNDSTALASEVDESGITAEPWQVVAWFIDTPTLTHPALQQFNAASTAQGGVFVAGGTQDGVYTKREDVGGRSAYGLLGEEFPPHHIDWSTDRWVIHDENGDGNIYYSLSDVASPDLASDWKLAADDTPAAITVTSFSVGDLAAGFKIGSETFVLNGSLNGRGKWSDVLGVAQDIKWYDRDDPGIFKWFSDSTVYNLGNVAFPWEGTPEVTVTKSNVAAEANWGPIP